MRKIKQMSFAEWIDKTIQIGIEKGVFGEGMRPDELDLKEWEEQYYDDGLTPEEAIENEM